MTPVQIDFLVRTAGYVCAGLVVLWAIEIGIMICAYIDSHRKEDK